MKEGRSKEMAVGLIITAAVFLAAVMIVGAVAIRDGINEAYKEQEKAENEEL